MKHRQEIGELNSKHEIRNSKQIQKLKNPNVPNLQILQQVANPYFSPHHQEAVFQVFSFQYGLPLTDYLTTDNHLLPSDS
jgi:hypothetical protein